MKSYARIAYLSFIFHTMYSQAFCIAY